MEEDNKNNKTEQKQDNKPNAEEEGIYFPWTGAIIIGVLMLLIVICFIIVMVLPH